MPEGQIRGRRGIARCGCSQTWCGRCRWRTHSGVKSVLRSADVTSSSDYDGLFKRRNDEMCCTLERPCAVLIWALGRGKL